MGLLKKFWYEEDGLGVVEIVLILVILLGLVVIFRESIVGIFKKAMQSLESSGNKLVEPISKP